MWDWNPRSTHYHCMAFFLAWRDNCIIDRVRLVPIWRCNPL